MGFKLKQAFSSKYIDQYYLLIFSRIETADALHKVPGSDDILLLLFIKIII